MTLALTLVVNADLEAEEKVVIRNLLLVPHRDEYTVSQLPGGEEARFAVSGVVCSREDMTLVHFQPLPLSIPGYLALSHSLDILQPCKGNSSLLDLLTCCCLMSRALCA